MRKIRSYSLKQHEDSNDLYSNSSVLCKTLELSFSVLLSTYNNGKMDSWLHSIVKLLYSVYKCIVFVMFSTSLLKFSSVWPYNYHQQSIPYPDLYVVSLS